MKRSPKAAKANSGGPKKPSRQVGSKTAAEVGTCHDPYPIWTGRAAAKPSKKDDWTVAVKRASMRQA